MSGYAALLFHASLVAIFFAFGIPELAFVNVASVALWYSAVTLLKRAAVIHGLLIGIFELLMHAVAATIVLGLNFGFQWYLLFVPVNVWFLPRGRRLLKLSATSTAALAIVALQIYGSEATPLYETSSAAAAITFALNWSVLISVISVNVAWYRELADRLEEEIRMQNERAHDLLLNILPKSVADRLEEDPDQRIVSHYGETSILFIDIVHFTELTQTLEPAQLVELLGHIFDGIDTICDEEGIEKVKTIGDAYMIAAGCPVECPDHAERAARCALRIRTLITEDPIARRHDLNVRIGIHSGPVVAGVIGKRKFAFDMWGQTVNVASRMESHGESGRIQISETTAEYLWEAGFALADRGTIRVKGVGAMRTWFLGAPGKDPVTAKRSPDSA